MFFGLAIFLTTLLNGLNITQLESSLICDRKLKKFSASLQCYLQMSAVVLPPFTHDTLRFGPILDSVCFLTTSEPQQGSFESEPRPMFKSEFG